MATKRIPISEIRRFPIRHEQLPAGLTVRIREIQLALDEVFPKPLETWIDEFKRDANPESEVNWWESLVACYRAYTEPKDLSVGRKKIALKILLMLGMGEDIRSLASDFATLPEGTKDENSAMFGPGPN